MQSRGRSSGREVTLRDDLHKHKVDITSRHELRGMEGVLEVPVSSLGALIAELHEIFCTSLNVISLQRSLHLRNHIL